MKKKPKNPKRRVQRKPEPNRPGEVILRGPFPSALTYTIPFPPDMVLAVQHWTIETIGDVAHVKALASMDFYTPTKAIIKGP